MPRKISQEKIDQMRIMFDEGASAAEIAKALEIKYGTANSYTSAWKNGFDSPSEYKNHKAKERGFESHYAYQQHLAKEKGFKTWSKYQAWCAGKKGFKSHGDYLAHRAEERGYDSYYAYLKSKGAERQKRPLNQIFSAFITDLLTELDKSQRWLARQIGKSQPTVSGYASGMILPREDVQKKIFKVLGVPYKTLDDILAL